MDDKTKNRWGLILKLILRADDRARDLEMLVREGQPCKRTVRDLRYTLEQLVTQVSNDQELPHED